ATLPGRCDAALRRVHSRCRPDHRLHDRQILVLERRLQVGLPATAVGVEQSEVVEAVRVRAEPLNRGFKLSISASVFSSCNSLTRNLIALWAARDRRTQQAAPMRP